MTAREKLLIRTLAVIGGAALLVLTASAAMAEASRLDREAQTLGAQVRQLQARMAATGHTLDSASLEQRKQDLLAGFYKKGELTVYQFAGQVKKLLASQQLAIRQLSLDATRNEVAVTVEGSVSAGLRLVKALQAEEPRAAVASARVSAGFAAGAPDSDQLEPGKYRVIRFLSIRQGVGSSAIIQIRVAYAESPL